MRLVDADVGDKELRRLYDVWNLAMAPAEGREIAAVDKNMRMLKLMQSFLKSLPTVETAPKNKLQCDGCENQKRDGFNYEVCVHCKRHWPDHYAHKPEGSGD